MIDKNDKIALRQILMEHYTKPTHKGLNNTKTNSYIKYQDSPTCSDEINVQLIFKDKKIIEANFDGLACSISGAAIDILCDQLENKTKSDALAILNNYHNLIVGKDYDENILDELIAFSHIYQQGNRVPCALLGAEGLRYILEEEIE